jgi:hypothetical protein
MLIYSRGFPQRQGHTGPEPRTPATLSPMEMTNTRLKIEKLPLLLFESGARITHAPKSLGPIVTEI